MQSRSTPSLLNEVSPRLRGLFLKNLGDFQTELARVIAGFVPSLVIWRHRKELPALIFRSLRRVQDLRQRGRELGVSFEEMHFSQNVAGRELLDELCKASNAAELFSGAMLTLFQTLIEAIADDLNRTKGVYDSPSAALLEADGDELKAQVGWAQTAVRELADQTGEIPDERWLREIELRCSHLAETLREHNPRSTAALMTGRQIGVLPFADAKLPEGFHHLEFGPEPLPESSVYSDRERFHAINFLQEVQAADSCASMLFEAPDMPWDFYLDLSRHMWDEARHAMFGEAKLLELGTSASIAGLSTKAYAMRQTLVPLDRYAALSTQEADAFPGKHAGLKDAVANNDVLSAKACSYDIADETQHLRFGTKWIPIMIEKTGEPRSYEQVKADACNWRVSVLAEVYKPAAATLR
jgi:hypothetical protein